MTFRSFSDYIEVRKNGVGVKNEYLNDKGKLVEKPKIELVPDYHGPDDKTPPTSKGQGKQEPYKAANSDPEAKKAEKGGMAEKGDKKLVYNPKLKVGDSKDVPDGKHIGHYPRPQTKTESFIDKTRNLSQADFIRYMKEECGCGMSPDSIDGLPMVNSYASGPFHPHPPEAIKYVVVLANKNDKILKDLVHEMKRSGGMSKLMKALFDHPESYNDLAGMFGDDNDGPKHSRGFTKAMADNFKKFMDEKDSMWEESVGPPQGLEDGEEEDGEKSVDDFPMGEEVPEGSEDEEEPEEGDEVPEDERDDEDDDSPGFDFDSGEEEPPRIEDKPRKLKKKFAHNHLLDAMAGHEHMMSSMKAWMKA